MSYRAANSHRGVHGVDRPGRSEPTGHSSSGVLWSALLIGSFLFIAAAVTLEVLAGEGAASPTAPASRFISLTWPQPARVLWWLAAAAGAATFRTSLRRLGVATRRTGDVASVAPFLLFAAGIAFGADWATWH